MDMLVQWSEGSVDGSLVVGGCCRWCFGSWRMSLTMCSGRMLRVS